MGKRQRIDRVANLLTKRLIDEGKLIEAGAVGYMRYVVSEDATKTQRDECLLAFMAGAEHVWSSVMNVLEEGDEPTDNDLRRMDLVQRELEGWRAVLAERVNPTQGRA